MMYSTYMQNCNSKYQVFLSAQKRYNLTAEVVNSTKFQTTQICQILSFLCSPEYMVFRVKILHVVGVHRCLQSRFFSAFFEKLK